MRYHRFDLNLLVVLDALLTERSVSRAARVLNLGQPAVSAALGRLRAYFDDKLLVWSGSTMQPTDLGRALAGQVRELLRDTEQVIFTRNTFDPATAQRRFVVSATDYTALVLLKKVSDHLSLNAPGITLLIRTNQLSLLGTTLLKRGTDDFIILPTRVAFDQFPCETLFEDEMVVVAWRDNTVIDGKVTRNDLLELSHVVVVHESYRVPPIKTEDEFFEEFGIRRKIAIAVPSYLLAPHLIVGTNHIAVLQQRAAVHLASMLPLAIYPLPIPFPKITLGVQWQASRGIDPGMVWFRTLLSDIARTI